MSERHPPIYDTIPTRGWKSPQHRDRFEAYYGISLGTYAHEFDETRYRQLIGAEIVGEGVARKMEGESSGNPEFKVIYHALFDKPDGTFSEGYLFLGAASRELAEGAHSHFVQEVNSTLENVGANFRLAEPTQ